MTVYGKILSAKFGVIGEPVLLGINVPKGSGAFKQTVGAVSGEADQVISEGAFSVMLIPTGVGYSIGVSSGEFGSPIRQTVIGRGNVLGDSWFDWFVRNSGA